MNPTETATSAATRLLYDRKGAAEQLSISVRSLDYLIKQKAIPTRRIAGRVLIPYSDLRKFARANYTSKIIPAGNLHASD